MLGIVLRLLLRLQYWTGMGLLRLVLRMRVLRRLLILRVGVHDGDWATEVVGHEFYVKKVRWIERDAASLKLHAMLAPMARDWNLLVLGRDPI